MKVYSVQVEAICNVVVLAESKDAALAIAARNIRCEDCELTTAGPAEEVVDDDDEARNTYIRHADKLFDGSGKELRPAQALQLIAS